MLHFADSHDVVLLVIADHILEDVLLFSAIAQIENTTDLKNYHA